MTRYDSSVDVPASHGAGSGMAQEGNATRVNVREVAVRPGVLKGSARPDVTPPLDDTDLLLGSAAGAALAALALGCAYWAVQWLAGQPVIFWRRVAAVAVVLVGAGAIAGGLAGLERAGRRRGR